MGPHKHKRILRLIVLGNKFRVFCVGLVCIALISGHNGKLFLLKVIQKEYFYSKLIWPIGLNVNFISFFSASSLYLLFITFISYICFRIIPNFVVLPTGCMKLKNLGSLSSRNTIEVNFRKLLLLLFIYILSLFTKSIIIFNLVIGEKKHQH